MARRPANAVGIPRARKVERAIKAQIDLTRGEYNRLIDIMNERGVILNELRVAIERLQHSDDVQFTRIAQMQARLDELRTASDKTTTSDKIAAPDKIVDKIKVGR